MLPLSRCAPAILLACCALPVAGHAQSPVARTASGGVCGSAGSNLVMLVEQDIRTLNSHLDRINRYAQDVAQMETCAARQRVWVRGHPTADADGCISVEDFRGPQGPTGPQGPRGADAICP